MIFSDTASVFFSHETGAASLSLKYPMDKYLSHHRMRDILADNPLLLPALSRFGIALGFGDRTVGEVCAASGVDVYTFIAIANFISGRRDADPRRISVDTLLRYLKSAHTYFLDYILPNIRKRLIEAVSSAKAPSDVSLVILKFYDEYVGEVRRHMEFEDTLVFGYVSDLLEGRRSRSFSIAKFRENHKPIAEKLNEIKEILICHFTADSARVDLLNSLLFDIVICERDLIAHCRVEDDIFVPAIEILERQTALDDGRQESADDGDTLKTGKLDDNGDIVLTPRERDIVGCIARGLQNKEIAERLFLSVHTVATHRRNICAKLNIHSASGMTIYAILHGIISIAEGESLIHA